MFSDNFLLNMKEKIWFILELFEGDGKIALCQQHLTVMNQHLT